VSRDVENIVVPSDIPNREPVKTKCRRPVYIAVNQSTPLFNTFYIFTFRKVLTLIFF